MPAAHHPGTEDGDLADGGALHVLRPVGAGVDGLEVEEERLDHVLGDLPGDQLGEVAGLDDLGRLEVDLGALDGRSEDVARGRVGAPEVCFLRLAGNAGRLAANLGWAGVPPGMR